MVSEAVRTTGARLVLLDSDPISRRVLSEVLAADPRLSLVASLDARVPRNQWPSGLVNTAVLVAPVDNQALRLVRDLAGAGVRVLFVSIDWTWGQVDALLKAGAAGCVTKDADGSNLPAAVVAAASGYAVMSPGVVALYRRGPMSWTRAVERDAPSASRISTLTDRERQVLKLLGGGLTTAEISDQLDVTASTVKSHISHALAKLGARNRLEAVLAFQGGSL
jgi:DNA-binding NarL/FixJ family response regulator